MQVRVRELFDEKGQYLAKWRFGGLPWHYGNLNIRTENVIELGRRESSCAKLRDDKNQLVIRALYDVTRLQIIDNEIQIGGFMFDPVFNRITAQSWFVELLDIRKIKQSFNGE